MSLTSIARTYVTPRLGTVVQQRSLVAGTSTVLKHGGSAIDGHDDAYAGSGVRAASWRKERSTGAVAGSSITSVNATLVRSVGFTAQRRMLHSTTHALKATAPTYPAESTQVPDFSKYKRAKGDPSGGRAFTYVMLGTTGFVAAAGAKNAVAALLTQLAPSADVLALAKVELDLTAIPEGKNVTIKWRGKPVFIRHRTAAEIAEANGVAITELRDPETDADRTKKPEWLVMLGICTHLGCVPIGEAGDYDGWYCPCHGSHYDISGRIRKGPAPLNLEIPPYDFMEDGTKLIIG